MNKAVELLMEKASWIGMGKSSMNGPFSMAMLNNQIVSIIHCLREWKPKIWWYLMYVIDGVLIFCFQ